MQPPLPIASKSDVYIQIIIARGGQLREYVCKFGEVRPVLTNIIQEGEGGGDTSKRNGGRMDGQASGRACQQVNSHHHDSHKKQILVNTGCGAEVMR